MDPSKSVGTALDWPCAPESAAGAPAHVPLAAVFVYSETRGQRTLNAQDGYGTYTAVGSDRVPILRVAPNVTMTTPNDEHAGSSSEAFERALATLLRDSFAAGTEIEDTWEIASPSDLVPDWRVVIEKTGGAVPPGNGDAFVDE